MNDKIKKATEALEHHIGKVAQIIGNHPHAGTMAKCVAVEYVSGVGKIGLKFEREDGRSFYVFSGDYIMWLYKKE